MELSETSDRFALTSMEMTAWHPTSAPHARDLARSYLLARGDVRQVSLDPIKEGRTATTFRARVVTRAGAQVLAIRVAHDTITAAARLRALAVDLRAWHASAPGAAAAVVDHADTGATAILATSWIDGEPLRVLHDADGAALARAGERLTAKQTQRVAVALAWARSRLALFDTRGVCEREIDVERGAVVVDATFGVTLVGSAGRTWCGRLGAWPYRLAAGSPVAPAAAVAAGLEALRIDPRDEVRALVPRIIEEARAFEPMPAEGRDAALAAVHEVLG